MHFIFSSQNTSYFTFLWSNSLFVVGRSVKTGSSALLTSLLVRRRFSYRIARTSTSYMEHIRFMYSACIAISRLFWYLAKTRLLHITNRNNSINFTGTRTGSSFQRQRRLSLTPQPDLREHLAILHRSGPFETERSLCPSHLRNSYQSLLHALRVRYVFGLISAF